MAANNPAHSSSSAALSPAEVERLLGGDQAKADIAAVLGDAETPSRQAYLERLTEIQAAVGYLMEYSAGHAELNIRDDFLNPVVPLLRKPPSQMGVDEEISLWSAYNQLSSLVAPVTVDSLKVAGAMRKAALETHASPYQASVEGCRRELWNTLWLMIFFIVAFFIIQGYAVTLTESGKTIQFIKSEYSKLHQRLTDVRTANPQIPDQDPRIASILTHKADLDKQVSAILKTEPLICFTCAEDMAEDIVFFERLTQSQIVLLTTHILPFVLGFLGAVTALVRQYINGLNEKSYTPGWPGRMSMRLCLGGLLGEISGVIFSPDQADLQALNLSVVFLAFLMGYSMDLAFSLFDRGIELARDILKPAPKSPESLARPPQNQPESSPPNATAWAEAAPAKTE